MHAGGKKFVFFDRQCNATTWWLIYLYTLYFTPLVGTGHWKLTIRSAGNRTCPCVSGWPLRWPSLALHHTGSTKLPFLVIFQNHCLEVEEIDGTKLHPNVWLPQTKQNLARMWSHCGAIRYLDLWKLQENPWGIKEVFVFLSDNPPLALLCLVLLCIRVLASQSCLHSFNWCLPAKLQQIIKGLGVAWDVLPSPHVHALFKYKLGQLTIKLLQSNEQKPKFVQNLWNPCLVGPLHTDYPCFGKSHHWFAINSIIISMQIWVTKNGRHSATKTWSTTYNHCISHYSLVPCGNEHMHGPASREYSIYLSFFALFLDIYHLLVFQSDWHVLHPETVLFWASKLINCRRKEPGTKGKAVRSDGQR